MIKQLMNGNVMLPCFVFCWPITFMAFMGKLPRQKNKQCLSKTGAGSPCSRAKSCCEARSVFSFSFFRYSRYVYIIDDMIDMISQPVWDDDLRPLTYQSLLVHLRSFLHILLVIELYQSSPCTFRLP